MSRIRELAVFPKMGTPLSSIVDFETDYRFLVCGNYTAFYRFENQTVYIMFSMGDVTLCVSYLESRAKIKSETKNRK